MSGSIALWQIDAHRWGTDSADVVSVAKHIEKLDGKPGVSMYDVDQFEKTGAGYLIDYTPEARTMIANELRKDIESGSVAADALMWIRKVASGLGRLLSGNT